MSEPQFAKILWAMDLKQRAYEKRRARYREQWQISHAEEFCARLGICPETGKWLVDLKEGDL